MICGTSLRAQMICVAIAGALAFAIPGEAQVGGERLPAPLSDPIAERIGRLEPRDLDGPRLAPQAVEAAGPAFRLEQVVVEGAAALTEEALRPLWRGALGRPVTLPELEAIAAAISARYRSEGFVLSQAVVPAQTVENGVVRIQVVEGFVDRVEIHGASTAVAAWTERSFARAASGRPLDIVALERAVLIARDTLGGSVETVLAPSPETLAAADLTVLVEPRRALGFAALDTRGSRLYGDVTATGGITFFGALGGTDRLDLLASGDPVGGRLGYARGDAAFPLPLLEGSTLDGAVLGLRIDASQGRPSTIVEDLRLLTDEVGLAAQLSVPFVRGRSGNIFGRVALDWRRSESTTRFGADEVNLRDTILAVEIGASIDRADRAGGVSIVDVTLRQGLDGAGAALGAAGPAASKTTFTRAYGRVARLQRLAEDWSLYAEALWQVAAGALPDGERLSLGGSTIGRGFAPGNTTGDAGYGLRLELRRQIGLGTEGRAAEVYGFGDAGRARDRVEERDGVRWESLASVGIGARVDLSQRLTLTPEIVRQIEGRSADRPLRDRHETRAFIGLVARF